MPEMAQREALISSVRAAESHPDPHQASAIPPWVHAKDSEEEQENLLAVPTHAIPNTRHYKPPAHYKPGRKWDHFRSAEPALLSAPIADHQERWKSFMHSGPNPYEREGRVVDAAWMEENMPHMNPDWRPDSADDSKERGITASGLMYKGKWLISPERQEKTVRLFWRLLLKNPYVPLVFRLTVLAFSTAALAMAAAIFINVKRVNADENPNNQCATRASTFMALSVGSIAVPYIGYVTWDEYMSKPLGLRSVAAKVLLLLCDLYFVCFASSNLSLALDALYDHRWACYDLHVEYDSTLGLENEATCPNNPSVCYKQKALSGVLMVSLIAWCVTFSISVLRVVERLRPD